MNFILGYHGTIGFAVVLLNVVVGLLLIRARRDRQPVPAVFKVLAYIGQLLLLIQVLIGLDLWTRGARPAVGIWGWLHMLLPIGALIYTIVVLAASRKAPRRDQAVTLSKAAWHTASVALVTYLIGMIG